MIHTEQHFTLADLPAVAEPPEGAGKRWAGIPHRELARALLAEVGKPEAIDGMAIHLSPDRGDVAIGLTYPQLLSDAVGAPCLAVFSSNARRFSLSAYVGISIPDDVSIPLGECVFGSSNTAEEVAHSIFVTLNRGWGIMNRHARLMMDTTIDYDAVCGLLVSAAENEWIQWRNLRRILERFRELSEERGSLTTWDLLRAYAFGARLGPVLGYKMTKGDWPGQVQSIDLFRKSLPTKSVRRKERVRK